MAHPFNESRLLWQLPMLMLVAAAAQAQSRYGVTVVGASSPHHISAISLNNAGQIAGSEFTGSSGQAVLIDNGDITRLGTLGGNFSLSIGVNDSGHVVGQSTSSAEQWRGFLYANGSMRDLGTLGGAQSDARAINNAGQITGSAQLSDGLWHAYRYSGGVITDLGTLGGTVSYGYDINAHGHVSGNAAIPSDPMFPTTHAFIHDGTTMRDLGTLGGRSSNAGALNDAGHAVGYAETADNFLHAFFYADGVMQDLGTLGGAFSVAYGINRHDQIVGASADTESARAFLYSEGRMQDLNSLIDPASGWVLSEAYDINDSQQILGFGCRAAECSVLLLNPAQPIPEPATWATVLSGLALLGLVAHRKRGPGNCAQRGLT